MLRLFAVLLTIGVILFAGWLTLRRDDIPFGKLETLYANVDSRYLSLGDNQQIHFRDTGPRNAPVIVLVHGFAASLHTWEPWVADLKRDYRVVSIDLPGHGLSTCLDNETIGPDQFVDVIDRLVRTLNIERFTLAGNSMGGSAAWHYALTHPQRLEALVLVNAAGWPREGDEPDSRPAVFRILEIGLARRVIRDLDLTNMIRSGLERSFADPSFVTQDMVDRYASFSRAPCHRDALLQLTGGRSNRQVASDELLSSIQVPTLVMHGDQDNVIPHSAGAKFAAAIPGAEYILYEGVGHLPQEEIAARSAADLRAFLNRARAPREDVSLAQ
ncbi:alpha/beta fold hydrolase [Hyphomonas sp.]|uniref:alpha/beta fold hydrolase n=1 Tax=Hyphomonas sp. TaxID=87 RepID=UPI0039189EAB